MIRRSCTARIPKGRTRTRPCRNVAPCTRVRILDAQGEPLEERWVCTTCRERMRLPAHDIDFQPAVTEVSDHIADDGPHGIDHDLLGSDGFVLP